MRVRGGPFVLDTHDHVVSFYDDDDDLIAEVSQFVASGLRDGDAVVVVATDAHLAGLDTGLARRGLDADLARTRGEYVCLDAAETLAKFMVGEAPDAERFTRAVGGVIDRAAAGGRRVRAFGEMVALLWDAGNVLGAVELESHWNELARTREFSLYCAYRLASLTGGGDLTAANLVCELHSDVVPPLSYGSGATAAGRVVGAEEARELFVPVPSAVKAARRFVHSTLAAWGEQDLLDDAGLIASELATNALRQLRVRDSPTAWPVGRADRRA